MRKTQYYVLWVTFTSDVKNYLHYFKLHYNLSQHIRAYTRTLNLNTHVLNYLHSNGMVNISLHLLQRIGVLHEIVTLHRYGRESYNRCLLT